MGNIGLQFGYASGVRICGGSNEELAQSERRRARLWDVLDDRDCTIWMWVYARWGLRRQSGRAVIDVNLAPVADDEHGTNYMMVVLSWRVALLRFSDGMGVEHQWPSAYVWRAPLHRLIQPHRPRVTPCHSGSLRAVRGLSGPCLTPAWRSFFLLMDPAPDERMLGAGAMHAVFVSDQWYRLQTRCGIGVAEVQGSNKIGEKTKDNVSGWSAGCGGAVRNGSGAK